MLVLMFIYTCFKTGSYFQLKCSSPFPLLSNVVFKFSSSRDANISYIGMTPQHLGTRIQEYHYETTKSAIRDHIEVCQNCKLNNTDLNRVLKFQAFVIQNMLQKYQKRYS